MSGDLSVKDGTATGGTAALLANHENEAYWRNLRGRPYCSLKATNRPLTHRTLEEDVNPAVFEYLVLCQGYSRAAWASGSGRDAVANGYTAVDIAFSALVEDHGLPTQRNHKAKLETVGDIFPALFTTAQTSAADVETFYQLWLDVRYTTTSVTPLKGVNYLRLSDRIIDAIIDELATRAGEAVTDVLEQLQVAVLGGTDPKVEQVVSDVHDMIQTDLEIQAERYDGPKLGMKLTNPARFCQILASASDPTTQRIIAESDDIAHQLGHVYKSFVDLVNTIQMERYSEGTGDNETTNFAFSVRLGYYGLSVEEIYEEFIEMMKTAENDPRVTSPRPPEGQ